MREQIEGKYIPPVKGTKGRHSSAQGRVGKGKSGQKLRPMPNGGQFIVTEVDSPYGERGKKPIKEKVARRTSDNPLLLLLSRNSIDQAEFLAGHKYMGAHLVCTGQTGQAIDYSRQRVDCSTAPMTLSEKQMQASDLIRNANRELKSGGVNEKSANEAVLRMQKIAGEGYSVTQYCKNIRGLTSTKSVGKQLGFLRDDLILLAKYWGFAK